MAGNRAPVRIVWRAMQPVSRSRQVARTGIFGLVVALVVLAGCSPTAPSSAPNVVPPIVGPLVTVETRGGECPEGPCGRTVTLERDGRVKASGETADIGRVQLPAYQALEAAINATDFAAIRSQPFTGECPVNFDGQELIFTFSVGNQTERLASCESELDWSSPLFVAITAALGEHIPIPFS
jgi:hypothetical protein